MITAPKSEILWLQLVKDGRTTHVITSTALRDTYYLYKVGDNDKLIKTKHKSADPTELEQYINESNEKKEYEDVDYEF